MSLAWEVTREDVYHVLAEHSLVKSFEDRTLERAWDVVSEEADQIEDAVLHYTDFDDQVASMHDEIENILISHGFIQGDKQFAMTDLETTPESEDDEWDGFLDES